MDLDLNLSPSVRKVIYVVVVMGTALVVPLGAAEVVNDTVVLVWTSLSGAASLLARLNVTGSK